MKKSPPHAPRRTKSTAVVALPPSAPAARPDLAIVGVGASAGGLEALEQFLGPVPPTCGLAFVIVQHLDPSRKGMLTELLQRTTAMPVVQIEDGMRVAPGHVYVIPPNHDLALVHGVLHLREPAAPRGLRLPIDSFLRALAEDQQEHSIGVILSGMGSDGTLGLRAIKEKAGAAFVQSPVSAKFDGMPRSAIAAGLADVVAPAEQLVDKIIAYRQHAQHLVIPTELSLADAEQHVLERIIVLLRVKTGHDFSHYKKSTLYRRVERRMSLHQLPTIAEYLCYLRDNPQEAELLFKELLIGVTSFFRDPTVWEQLKTEVIPALLAARPSGGTLRAWSAGCSTGEEAYTLAIVFREALEQIKPAACYSLQIFATDLDKEAIDKARAGVYPPNIAADVSAARLRRFFVHEERGYRVSAEIRELVIFAPQNLVMDPPFTKLDLLVCRNLLIYLEKDLQHKLLPLFHYSLNPGGILVLGSAESIGQTSDLFAPLPGKTRLYCRHDAAQRADLIEFPAAFSRPLAEPSPAAPPQLPALRSAGSLQALTDSVVLSRYAPAAVLTTSKGDIVYISGRTGKYLEPPTGKTNVNVFAMARPGLGIALNEVFARAIREKSAVTMKNVAVGTNGGTQVVDVTVQFLDEPAALRGMLLIVFADVARPPVPSEPSHTEPTLEHSARLTALAQEVQQSREELQTTREEMQTSQEELKSTNEELQSTNEELQSTNEELTTSKEEMQSMNEELQTVNHELQARVDELSRASDDMKNLLNSTGIATLFLDNELNVRSFTTQTATIIKLIPSDAGRPVTDLVSELDYPELAEDALEVLRSLIFHERQASAKSGRWFSVRIMPYRTQDHRIDGVVITFTDLSAVKRAELAMREALAVLQGRLSDQAAELDAKRELERVLQQAQVILESRLAEQTTELRQTRGELHAAKTKKS